VDEPTAKRPLKALPKDNTTDWPLRGWFKSVHDVVEPLSFRFAMSKGRDVRVVAKPCQLNGEYQVYPLTGRSECIILARGRDCKIAACKDG
jgi:hypothetical protein